MLYGESYISAVPAHIIKALNLEYGSVLDSCAIEAFSQLLQTEKAH